MADRSPRLTDVVLRELSARRAAGNFGSSVPNIDLSPELELQLSKNATDPNLFGVSIRIHLDLGEDIGSLDVELFGGFELEGLQMLEESELTAIVYAAIVELYAFVRPHVYNHTSLVFGDSVLPPYEFAPNPDSLGLEGFWKLLHSD